MKITVNGKMEDISDNTSIDDFLRHKKLVPEKIVVEHNLEIVERENFGDVMLKEKDSLEILQFVGGG